MSDLEQSGTPSIDLPVRQEPATPRPSLAFSAPTAAFVSQLIAARAQMPTQRARRIGTAEGAVGAYGQTARLSEKRMPQGYRKTVVA
ncbi:hypothetical protein [Devosia lucknowensis]|nr:hypothetical protein [Devosia lucknowensis]